MSIQKKLENIKQYSKGILGELFVILVIILVGLGSFGLGRLSVIIDTDEPVHIRANNLAEQQYNQIDSGESVSTNDGGIVASKNGTKYHFPWCSGATRMKEANWKGGKGKILGKKAQLLSLDGHS
jgi:hypothetical protein